MALGRESLVARARPCATKHLFVGVTLFATRLRCCKAAAGSTAVVLLVPKLAALPSLTAVPSVVPTAAAALPALGSAAVVLGSAAVV